MTAQRLQHRKSVLWVAALVHRLSGLALAIFLPLHFLTLGLALNGEARLEGCGPDSARHPSRLPRLKRPGSHLRMTA